MKIIGVIPARYQSSRFPGKPLVNILGKSMIQRVYEQSLKCSLLNKLIVATDDERILNHVESYGGESIMTSTKHNSGTDRCNEAVKKLHADYDLVINIQGDEPYINPLQIDEIINLFVSPDIQIATLAKKINDIELYKDYNTPKVILSKDAIALTFFREIANSSNTNYYQHIGIYGYRTEILSEICKLPQSENEKNYSLEQLRWIDNDYKIKVGITQFNSFSVDTPEDIIKIETQMG